VNERLRFWLITQFETSGLLHRKIAGLAPLRILST